MSSASAIRESYSRTCPESDEEVGYHENVYWRCLAVAEKLGRRPEAPENWWQRRFAWILSAVIDWMVKVTQLTTARHTRGGQKTRSPDERNKERRRRTRRPADAQCEWLVREANLPEHHDGANLTDAENEA